MTRNRLEIIGLENLMRDLRNLPEHLTDRANAIVTGRATRASSRIRANYHGHRVTGNLEGSVDIRPIASGRFAAGVQVRARAHHAHLFEYGTVARSYSGTDKRGRRFSNASRGTMPKARPSDTFVDVMKDERREMFEDFAELLERAGLEVVRG